MKVILNSIKKSRKKSLIIALVFIVIIGLTLGGYKVYSNITGRENYSRYANVDDTRKNLWDKMKVTSAVIAERKTGTSFNSGSSSNMNGIDVSANDEYVKIRDTVEYSVELNIDANTNIPGVTDSTEMYGGVIKFKATVPKTSDGQMILRWRTQGWMSNTSLTNDRTVLEGEYHVPSNTNVLGAIQQLTFTLDAGLYKGEIATGPTFEFWMEGNIPDNETGHTSVIPKYTVVDGPLKVTGRESEITTHIRDGVTKRLGRNADGVLGEYWTIGVFSSADNSSYGYYHKKIDQAISKIRLEMYYSNNSSGSSASWIKAEPGSDLYNKTIGRAQVVAVNKNGEANSNAYPNSKSNYLAYYSGFSDYNFSINGKLHKFDSGDISATLNNGDLIVTNTNMDFSYYDYEHFTGNYNGIYYYKTSAPPPAYEYYYTFWGHQGYYFSDAIELFIPFTEAGTDNRDYQIRAVLYESDFVESNTGKNIKYSRNSMVSTQYSDVSGNVFMGNITINGKDDTDIAYGSRYSMKSTFYGVLPDYFGEERLINVDASKFTLTSSFSYSSSNGKARPSDLKVYYGIYKNDPIGGLNGSTTMTPLEEINVSTFDDFYWYDTLDKAKACSDLKESGYILNTSTCYPTSIRVVNPSYIGDNESIDYTFEITPQKATLNDLKQTGKSYGSVRQKIFLYTNAEHTRYLGYHDSNTKDSFKSAVYNDNMSISMPSTPSFAGATAAIYGDTTGVSLSSYDENGNHKTNFNVNDESISFRITPHLNKIYGNNDLVQDNYQLFFTIPSRFEFDTESVNVEPSKILKEGNYTYVIWEFKNCQIGGVIPGSCDGIDDSINTINFKVNIDPFITNNSTNYFYAYVNSDFSSYYSSYYVYPSSGERYRFDYHTSSSQSVNVTNLSGAYAREVPFPSNLLPGEKFTIDNNIYNNSQKVLTNVKTYQEIPKNGDTLGSTFEQGYTLKITSLQSNQKIYYTTLSAEDSGVTYDENGKKTIENVNLATDSRWIELKVGDVVPANAVALASTISEVSIGSSAKFTYEVVPNNNKPGDKYSFKMFASSDNLSSSIASNTTRVNVYNRTLSGIVFNDINRDNLYTTTSELYAGGVVKLYNDNDELVATTTTLADGSFKFERLERDNYYLMYELNNSNYEFVTKNVGDVSHSSIMNKSGKTDLLTGLNVISDGSDVNVTQANIGFKKKEASLTVNYYIEGTTTKLIDSSISTVYWGDSYTTSPSTHISSNYELASHSNNTSGTVSGDIVVNYYYKLKEATLTVKFLEAETDVELTDPIIETVYYGNRYEAEESTTVPLNYELLRKTNNFAGVVSIPEIEVIFYYQKKDSTLETSISKVGPEEITSKSSVVVYDINYNATMVDYIGTAKVTIVDTLPYDIDLEQSDLASGSYNQEDRTVTWEETIEDIDTYNGKDKIAISKRISIKYSNIVDTDRTMINSVKGNIILDNNSRDIEDQSKTDINVKGTIIVHHYMTGTTEKLEEDVEVTDLIGTIYESNALVKEGYEVVKEPEVKEVAYIEGTIELVYEYKRIELKVVTKVNGKGGSITGSEGIFYGEDSTEGFIVIQPDEGYEVANITVNGERIAVTCNEGCTLNKFIHMTEDKEVVVTFEKKVTNPDTFITISLRFIIGLVVMLSVAVLLKLKIHKKIFKV